jgi:sigma-B regulation protein RsbU (phosphoserine phosphatase)
MAAAHESRIREELLDRRQRLEGALPTARDQDPLQHLLREVDSALDRLESGTWGVCETCHEAVEADRLQADPLLRYCLDHLTPRQQQDLQQDLELTSRIQLQLLPRREARFDGWRACYHYEPLGAVSGDYCELNAAPGGSIFFAVGDVSGKGVAASMLMAHLSALFRGLVAVGLPMFEIVERANRIFCESAGEGRYATLACGMLAPDGAIEIVNAGHIPPLLISGGQARGLPATGLPIGLFCAPTHAVETLRLAPGDSLVVVTDGVTEARDRSGCEYGMERLSAAAAGGASLAPQELLAACITDVVAFRAGTPRNDDATILVLRREV